MPIEILGISIQKYTELLRRGEGHFLDFKSKNIAAARLTRSLSAFGNADGGELYLGIEDGTEPVRSRWVGFASVENANGFIQTFEEFFPLGRYFRYEFLRCDPLPGLVLHCEIAKTPDIR